MEGDGLIPYEMELGQKIDRWGVKAVMGRDVLGFGEMRRMTYCSNMSAWHNQKAHSKDWAEFAEKNKYASEALNEAMILASVSNGE